MNNFEQWLWQQGELKPLNERLQKMHSKEKNAKKKADLAIVQEAVQSIRSAGVYAVTPELQGIDLDTLV
jgi:hypothetical protein